MIFNPVVQSGGGGAPELVSGILRGSPGTSAYIFDGQSVQEYGFTRTVPTHTVSVPKWSPASPIDSINAGAIECGFDCAIIVEDGFDIQVS